jgi:hypothetical protein
MTTNAVIARLRRTVRPDVLVGTLLGLATFALYSVGAGRTLSYDSASTVGYFVMTPSWLDPFRRQVDLNNQPLLSFAERVVVHLTGSHSEPVLRFLPALAAAVTVGLLAVVAARRLGIVAGVTAGVVLATNVTFVVEAREVRGYSCAALCSLVATLLLLRLLRSPSRRIEAAYVLTIGVGIGMHLYVVLLVVAHVTVVVVLGRTSWRWVARWAAALACGALPYVVIGPAMLRHPGRGRGFLPPLPVLLVRAVAGVSLAYPFPSWALAVGLVALVAGAVVARPRRVVLAVAGVQVAAFLGIWLVVRPADTYARFWTFLLPGCAWLVASLVSRFRWLAVPVLAACAAMVSAIVPGYRDDVWDFRTAAALVDDAAARGLETCSLDLGNGSTLQPLFGYTHRFRVVSTRAEVRTCDVVVRMTAHSLREVLGTRAEFPYGYLTRASSPILIVSKVPLTPAGG